MRFDVAIDAQGLTKSAVAAWLSGARRRIGLGGRWGRELSPWLNNERVEADGLHAVDRSLRLLRPLGIDVAGGAVPGARSAGRPRRPPRRSSAATGLQAGSSW